MSQRNGCGRGPGTGPSGPRAGRASTEIWRSSMPDAERTIGEEGEGRMPVLKKVLVAVDFSKLSHEALDYAVELARSAGAAVTALYVVEPIEFAGVDVLGGAPMASQAIVD